MPRAFRESRLVVASHNKGKVREIAELLSAHHIEVISAGELGLPEPEETGTSFAENAELKAHAAATASGLPALSDDSGIALAALDGAPGIHSARWGGPERDFSRAMQRVQETLPEGATRDASFVCALTLAWPDGHSETFEGTVAGQWAWPPRGERGFGYDPAFVPNGYDETFGEMDPRKKDRISHRADAFRKLVAARFEAETE